MSDTATHLKPDNYETAGSQVAGKSRSGELQPTGDLVDYVKDYAREKPEVAALWCLGVGFILGWKLKPW